MLSPKASSALRSGKAVSTRPTGTRGGTLLRGGRLDRLNSVGGFFVLMLEVANRSR